MRILYSFPHALGRPGIGTTAYHQVEGAIQEGLDVVLACTSVERPLDGPAELHETLVVGGRRIPHRVLGVRRAYRLHDRRVATLLRRIAGEIDLVHVWPAGAVETLTAARELGVPTVREVPNTHTQFAFEAVEQENRRLGLEPEPGHSHTFTPDVLELEEAEYRLADALLVPSEFSRRTFLERGLPPGKLVLHRYGCDPARFHPPVEPQRASGEGLRALFVGSCEPRKGLHHALRAWIDSGAAARGRFLVCGNFVPGYREALEPLISHPSVEVRDFVADPAEAMRTSDVLLVPSVEEGSALVTYEAQACGCVLLVADAAGARCTHGRHALVHPAGGVSALTEHLRMLDEDRPLLARLRRATLADRDRLTWSRAASELTEAYSQVARGRAPALGAAYAV